MRADTHTDTCSCTACQLRRLVGELTDSNRELVLEVKRLRHDLTEARTAMVREMARRK